MLTLTRGHSLPAASLLAGRSARRQHSGAGAFLRRPQRVRASAKDVPPPPDVEKLANLARLSITPEEVKEWTPKISAIVDWFGKLRDVDLEGVPPALRAGEDGGADPLRPDVARAFDDREALLKAPARTEPPYIYVPKIQGEPDG